MRKRGFLGRNIIGIMIVILSCLAVWGCLPVKLYASSVDENRWFEQVVLVAIPGFSFMELEPAVLEEMPNLQRLVKQSGFAAMNIRTQKRQMSDVYVSLGAGANAVGMAGVQTFGAKELWGGASALELMNRYSGKPAFNVGEVLVPQVHVLDKANKNSFSNASPGTLGESLKQHGVLRMVLGSSDLGITFEDPKKLRRYAAQMLMDRAGGVDRGVIGNDALMASVDRPFGVKTDYKHLLSVMEEESNQKRVVLLELGDLYRLYADRDSYSAERFVQLKLEILQELDECLGVIAGGISKEGVMWIFSPEVGVDAVKEKAFLAPVIRYSADMEGGVRAGLLVSETTRRVGVIAYTDLSASLLTEFGIRIPKEMTGQSVEMVSQKRDSKWLISDVSAMQTIYRLRLKLLLAFATYEVIVLLLCLVFMVFIGFRPYAGMGIGKEWAVKACRICLLTILAAPCVMLVMGLWIKPLLFAVGRGAVLGWMYAGFVLVVLVGAYLLQRVKLLSALSLLAWIVSVMILTDGLTGAYAMRYSVLSYDPMIGARYYGIGNELMGVLIGALLLAVTVSLQRWHIRLAAGTPTAASGASGARAPSALLCAALLACAVFALVTVYLAAPSLGANAGGALSAAIAFGAAGTCCCAGKSLRELRWSRVVTLLAALLAVGLLALWLLNSADSPAAAGRESHVGRAFHALREGQFDQLRELIVRKLRMNRHLIGVSAWSKVLITSLFVMAVLVLRPRGRLVLWQNKYPYLMYGFAANTLGAIAALLLNDSGIVAAATLIVYVAVPMLLLRLEEEQSQRLASLHKSSASHSS
ncbi:hypothetical protein [Paenibacillus eucommiae]|uniref:Uncharacterized protein n=1 Tax=Paenibacillus eucommiae TaxID=1355755 RepID=A0ABS4J8B9_9BACL|nr:hypothetical protein [Paenibacillus eucommiae]MBP1994994.1 hypothetical protein [Paenibacillus eucommiae]